MLVYQNSTEINLHIRVNVSHQHSECNRSVLHIYRKHSLCKNNKFFRTFWHILFLQLVYMSIIMCTIWIQHTTLFYLHTRICNSTCDLVMSKQHRHKITHQQIASHQLVNGYFKNIPFTLAYEHHLWICHQLNSSQQKEIFYTNLMRLKRTGYCWL